MDFGSRIPPKKLRACPPLLHLESVRVSQKSYSRWGILCKLAHRCFCCFSFVCHVCVHWFLEIAFSLGDSLQMCAYAFCTRSSFSVCVLSLFMMMLSIASRGSKSRPRGPKTPPRAPQEAPRAPQEPLKSPRSPKTPPRSIAPRSPKSRPRPQEAPKTAPTGRQMLEDRPPNASRRP